MSDLLEIQSEAVLQQTVQEVVLLEPAGSDDMLEVPTEQVLLQPSDNNTLLEPIETLVLLTESKQGPPGPPGSGSGSGGGEIARTEVVDYSSALYAYLGYPTRICRIDYTVSPPVVRSAPIADLAAEWPNRTGLTYT